MRWVGLAVVLVGCTGQILDRDPYVEPDPSADAAAEDALADGQTDTSDAGLDAPIDVMRVDVPPSCEPEEEACNGEDDDCDGLVDEALVIMCGESTGACEPGVARCVDGAFAECTPAVGPAPAESCDGVDEDCDGSTDEEVGARACGSDVGACSAGMQVCAMGVFGACMGQVGPATETCNNIDDNCDGMIDNGIAARACGSAVGACSMGTQSCSAGAWGACGGGVTPRAETCNGIDDNCDGMVDNLPPRTCGTNTGRCRTGTQACVGGSWAACSGNVAPRPERDNGIDDDCNGVIDNGIPCESARERQQRVITSNERVSRGLSPLTCDRGLRRAARKHAQDMCDRNYFSHTTRGSGLTPTDRINREMVSWTRNGENIAHGGIYASPMQVHTGWMNSSGHRANILNPDFGRLGVGYATCAPLRDPYWVQNFAN